MSDVVDQLNAALTGRYRIERELGRGGMATVYLAEDQRHERSVALKVMSPDIVEAIGAERFLREIRVTANLQHPHILPLFDSGEAGGVLFYVMPYVEGESLRDRLRREGALPVSDVIRILREIVDALGAAHTRGIVHRDVKPANVLLAGRHAQVADFGVAKALSEISATEHLTTMGVAVGTPKYMAPEQAAADPRTDHRADLFAAGVIAYEMLTGESPFSGETAQSTLAALLTRDPDPLTEVREDVPSELAELIHRCLEKDPDARWQSASELLARLEGSDTPAGTIPATATRGGSGERLFWISGGAAAAAALLLFFGLPGEDREAWARNQALPEIEALADVGDFEAAHRLVAMAREAIPDDPALAELQAAVGAELTIETTPPGASVSRREYAVREGEWTELGTTPIRDAPVPLGPSRYRFELQGYEPVELLHAGGGTRTVPLQPTGTASGPMVSVEGFTTLIGEDWVEVSDFLIDRDEVTNEAYKAFVDAGGYERQEFWDIPFTDDGRVLDWDSVVAGFTDRTGRPGPATWEVGSYPEGHERYPVGGVSWYEAAAYARFAGKSLPTVHHWNQAFNPGHQAYLIPQSNLETTGPREVGANPGVSWAGAFDMMGNVREWCLNANGDDRYIMGGGWTDAGWLAYASFAQSPFDRSETNGIRLARYGPDEDLAATATPVAPAAIPDYASFDLISDEVFEIYRRRFSYDASPLRDRVEAEDTSRYWIRETVTFDAAYGDERMILYLYLPRDASPPFQTVVLMPGSNALGARSIEELGTSWFDFVLKSGRAAALPVYRGTLERETELAERAREQNLRFASTPRPTSYYTEHVIQWVKDLGRTIDYLELRPEADADKLAFYGVSWGGRMGNIMLALESRFDAAVLNIAGFSEAIPEPEVFAVTYAPRVTLPVLMLNGRYDHVFPLEAQARPMFERLGTPAEHKRQVVSIGGHFVERTDLIRESLAWLDQYLGPVR